jgi:hypothetical protein
MVHISVNPVHNAPVNGGSSINYAYKDAYVWNKNNVLFVQVVLGSPHTYHYHPDLISINPERHCWGKESSIPLQYFKI